ncbi:unnamed protein product [Hymenolepis diminuta]|uniref:RIIa domain-containing protein n=1 Tax=Hymenolepis diminuta TaxID=6216 RepID=A0A564YUU7_HYMDI|nr:unnamed protein product [Hymenolepis diminuta]
MDNSVKSFSPLNENPTLMIDKYMAKHGIERIFEKLVEKLVTVRPENPIDFMIQALNEI